MKTEILIFLCAILCISSCQIEENPKPNVPKSLTIDVDKNGVDDFQIRYFDDAIIYSPTASEAILCDFEILGNNEILNKKEAPFLFLKDITEIKKDVSDPFYWQKNNAQIASLENHYKNGWGSTWKIASNGVQDQYLIGIKLNNIAESKIGWIKITIDNKTGQAKIIDSEVQ
ncbi:MAG TPA: hypothetical protein PKD51_12645 [Saprospiraceae bacterium]|nr:hypothetical protein [Saprospiraceae bacterium]